MLFITTNNLATNPRLVKEIKIAILNGYAIEIICFEFDNWSQDLNRKLKQELGDVKIIAIPAGRNPFYTWISSVVKETVFRFLGKYFYLSTPALSQAISRRSNLIVKALKKVSKPDWVIGHNPGALWPTIVAGKKFNCKTGFDLEDYHPGEGVALNLQSLAKKIMIRLLPQMDYVSFASPLIMQAVERDLNKNLLNSFTILNYFPADEFKEPMQFNNGPVKLVWFSQNINTGRGLEFILPFIQQENGNIELHLIGNLNPVFYESALSKIPNIIIHGPMSQQALHALLGDFDIGLALEPAKDENNELAISNKMLAYLQAGLFVVASNTKAQESYLDEMPDNGTCFNIKKNDAGIVLKKILGEIDTIRRQRKTRYKCFQNKNWEHASTRLLKAWEGRS